MPSRTPPGAECGGYLGIEPLISPIYLRIGANRYVRMYRKADAHPIVNKSAHAVKCCLPCPAGTYVHSKIP